MIGSPQSGFSLRIATQIPIPGATPSSQGDHDLLVIRGTVRLAAESGNWQACGDAIAYHHPGIASFLCRPNRIVVDADPAAPESLVAELLVANALPTVLWQRGSLVLHASAVVLPRHEAALVIAGSSGTGKSSVASALLDIGASLVGDDSVAISGSTLTGLSGGIFAAIDSSGNRRFVNAPPSQSRASAPIGSVVVLAPRGESWSLRRVGLLEALQLLLAHRHRPGVVGLLGRNPHALEQVASLARKTPVWIWQRSEGMRDICAAELATLAACFDG